MKFQKLEKRRVKIPKICIFFGKMGLKVSHHASKNKKILSRVFSPYKAPESILYLIIVLNGEKWILKRVRNFQIWVKSFKKKFKILVRILFVKSREKTKLKKNKKSNFFRKKNNFCIFFPIRIFSWKTDKLVPKLAKSSKNMCLRPIYNFCEKKHLIWRF